MNARPKAILGYIVGWLLTVCFVVLFTIIFSFVGTLICAALAGMMMGAARLPWWPSLTLSVLFPGVLSAYFRVTKAELPPGQLFFLSALCFGIFWIIFLALWGLTSHERRAAPAVKSVGKTAGPPVGGSRGSEVPSVRAAVAPLSRGTVAPVVTLATLQGKWLAGGPGSEAGKGHRRMEIRDDTILLSLTDESGTVHLAKAHLKLCADCVFGIGFEKTRGCHAPQFEISI